MASNGGKRGGGPGGADAMREMTASAQRMKISADDANLPPPILAEKRPPGARGQKVNVVTNVYGLLTPKNTPVYRYDCRVEAVFTSQNGERRKELTKQSREDFTSIDRKTKCAKVFKHLLKREGAFFGTRSVIYDRGSIMYTVDKLPLLKDEVKDFHITRTEMPNLGLDDKCNGLEVKLKQCEETFELILDDFKSAVNQNLALVDRSLAQFLEILTSQEAFFSDGVHVAYGTGQSFLMNHYDFGFNDRDAPELPDGKYVGIGNSKSVRMIEGPKGPGGINAAVIIDTKKAAFHNEQQSVIDKIAAILQTQLNRNSTLTPYDLGRVHRQLKGLMVKCTHGDGRKTFQISGFSRSGPNKETFQLEGRNCTIESYYKEKYGVQLQYPNIPCLLERTPRGTLMFPPELCVTCENQRVTQAQQTPAQTQVMIRACATLPIDRQRQNQALVAASKLNNGGKANSYLAGVGVTTSVNALSCEARQLPAPSLEYNGSVKVKADNNTGLWRADKYVMPARLGKWAMYGLFQRNERFNERDLNVFAERLVKMCQMKGMQVNKPEEISVMEGTTQQLEQKLKMAKQKNFSFVFFVQSTNLHLHKHMKMLEAQLQLPTQDLTTQTAGNVVQKGQPQTVENIVNKMNLKLGGHNFNILLENDKLTQQWLLSGTRLFIGIDVSHPPPMSAQEIARGATPKTPSVVGFAANSNKNPLEFVGDFRYQEPRREETVMVMKDITAGILKQFKANRGTLPEHIFLFRDGISEGQYKLVIQLEAPAIRDGALAVGGPGYKPKLTVIVGQRAHNIRIFPAQINREGRAPDQNIKCGTVIDQFIVNPVITEFYLNSHRALQGTAKTPRYSVLVDDAKLTQDELQGVTYALCYGMQIVTLSTSLPAPIMIADRYAKRGLNNFQARFGEDSMEGSTESGQSGGFNFEMLNQELSNAGKPLAQVRVNA